ncbi:helix-turn-helix domain-containing protein [Aeoliella mucimassa]|uniref:Helix-turn-helix domain-containing protein n=1 Tax=Aeoliella mucimassa TaxID=2527972 RepID=A0A518ARN2_9BACT|nr:helix-turn-helix domain-containing protein [Aeoliella mucimassa]QDU57374.1 hypothetical protein Pan181_35890 [Aeoliella mucimassa]
MNLAIDATELQPLVREVVAEVVREMALLGGSTDRLAYPEAEAAGLLGIRGHQLRDARHRGEIVATKVGGRIGYERSELIAYLARNRS